MLSASKIHLAAGLKVSGLSLRKAELDFHVLRYVAISGFSSIAAALGYIGIIKIKIPVRDTEKKQGAESSDASASL